MPDKKPCTEPPGRGTGFTGRVGVQYLYGNTNGSWTFPDLFAGSGLPVSFIRPMRDDVFRATMTAMLHPVEQK